MADDVLILIPARMASTRLPGKPLADIAGQPMIVHVLRRAQAARLGPELKKRGLLFTGIDVIGPYLTEINVTSPTGIRAIQRLGGPDIAALIWDCIEKKRR